MIGLTSLKEIKLKMTTSQISSRQVMKSKAILIDNRIMIIGRGQGRQIIFMFFLFPRWRVEKFILNLQTHIANPQCQVS